MDKYKLVPVEPTASPTSGMNLGQRIQHVGGWVSERGTVEFGSVMAVGALVSHILRDIAVQGEPVAWRNIKEEKPEDGQDCITKMKHGIIQGTYCSEDDTFSGYYWREMGWYATHWVPAEEAIYTAPQPAEQQQQQPYDSAAVRLDKQCREAVAAALGFIRGGDYAWSYLLQQIKDITSAAEAQHPAEQQPAPDVTQLVDALESLIKGYVGLLEAGKDRITSLGGDCDPVPVMEKNDPWLRGARAALAAYRNQGGDV